MNGLVYILLVSFAVLIDFASAANGYITPECQALFKKNDPSKCCEYPLPDMPFNAANECERECKDSDQCCFGRCYFGDKMKIHFDGELRIDDFVRVIRFLINMPVESLAVWEPVTRKSAETCLRTGENDIRLA